MWVARAQLPEKAPAMLQVCIRRKPEKLSCTLICNMGILTTAPSTHLQTTDSSESRFRAEEDKLVVPSSVYIMLDVSLSRLGSQLLITMIKWIWYCPVLSFNISTCNSSSDMRLKYVTSICLFLSFIFKILQWSFTLFRGNMRIMGIFPSRSS